MRSENFTEGKILTPMLRFAIPALLAMLLQTLYGAVDLLIVGQFSDSANVSAVSTGSMTMQTFTSVVMGISMGVTILLGHQIGQKRPAEAGRTVGTSIVLFGIMAAGMTLLMTWASRPLAGVMQAPAEAFEQTAAYIRICSAGFVFIIAFNLLGAVFRGIGNAQLPLVSVAIASVSNVCGDLLLVAVFHMGAAGAALATVAAQALSVAISLLIIRRLDLPFAFTKADIRFDGARIGRILRYGVPLALQDFLVSISFMVIIGIVNTMGVTASAGVGVAERLCGLIMLFPVAFSQSVSAFVAQNYGAGQMDRADRALHYGIAASLTSGVILFWLSFFHGDLMAAVFSRDPLVVAAAFDYLKAYAIDVLLTSFMFCYTGYFTGMGYTSFVMLQGIIGGVGVRIPLAFLFSRIPPVTLFHIGLATPASSFVQIILCMAYFIHCRKARSRKESVH